MKPAQSVGLPSSLLRSLRWYLTGMQGGFLVTQLATDVTWALPANLGCLVAVLILAALEVASD